MLCQGRSAKVRLYQLWTREQGELQTGQTAVEEVVCIRSVIYCCSIDT